MLAHRRAELRHLQRIRRHLLGHYQRSHHVPPLLVRRRHDPRIRHTLERADRPAHRTRRNRQATRNDHVVRATTHLHRPRSPDNAHVPGEQPTVAALVEERTLRIQITSHQCRTVNRQARAPVPVDRAHRRARQRLAVVHAAARRLRHAVREAHLQADLGRAVEQLMIRRRAPHEDRRQGTHRPHDLLARLEALCELGGHERQVAGHPILRGARNSGQERAGIKALGCIHDLRIRLRDRRAQQNHRARNVVRRQRQDPTARTLQSQLGGLCRRNESLNRQADEAWGARARPRRRNDQVDTVEEMRVRVHRLGEAGVAVLGERILGAHRGAAQRRRRHIPRCAQDDNRVRRRMIRVRLALLVQLHKLMNRRVRQSDGTDRRASGHNKKSRRSHDKPPKNDGKRIYNKDKGSRSRRWRGNSRQ